MADKCLSVIKMIHYIFLVQERDYSFDLKSREKNLLLTLFSSLMFTNIEIHFCPYSIFAFPSKIETIFSTISMKIQ